MNPRIILCVPALSLCLYASAVAGGETDPGWSGFVDIGAGGGTSESNLLASVLTADLGDKRLGDLADSPDGEDFVVPAVRFQVGYTLASTGTRLFIGNISDTYLPFDVDINLVTQAGAKQPIDGVGTFAAALTRSSLPTEVWEDPYQTGDERGNTERTTSGTRLSWNDIFGTALEFDWKLQDIHIDDELSGESLPLTAAERRLLRREGTVNNVGLSYNWRINDRHTLVPGVAYVDFDLDGDAMAMDGQAVTLTHRYRNGDWGLHSTIGYRSLEASETNPIYDAEMDEDSTSVSVTALYSGPFGLRDWTLRASAAYRDSDSNIDFYDSSLLFYSIGMIYEF